MYEATLSIDLGASYTKIAYRKALAPRKVGTSEEHARVLMIDNSPLIPTLAVRTRNASKPWVFGWEAANLNPDRDMEVFLNWKAGLFRPANDRDSASAITVAGKFFEWLRSKLEAAKINLKNCQTRVAMPAFDTFDQNAEILARCMDLSGWDNPSLILKVREPHGNTIGLFSRGRNVVGRNAAGELLLNYGQMFGQNSAYVGTSRGFTLHGTHGNLLRVLVVDIGAFTTDVAALTFDITSPGNEMADGLSALAQESYALGVINELDKPLFAALAEKHGFTSTEVSFNDNELLKAKLYHRQPYTLLTRSRGIIELGGAEDAKLVATHMAKFAGAIWEKISAFVQKECPTQVFLTGGGSLIPAVALMLEKKLSQRLVSVAAIEAGDGALPYPRPALYVNLFREGHLQSPHVQVGAQRF